MPFFTDAFVISLMFHPVGRVHCISAGVAGLTLSMMFVLPHWCGDSEFPLPNNKETGAIDIPGAIHQVHVKVDFAKHNRLTPGLSVN